MSAHTPADISEAYAARRAELIAQVADETRWGARLGALRLATFVLAAVAGWKALGSGSLFNGWGAVALAALTGFALGVVSSRRSRERLRWSRDRLTIAEEGLARVRRDWSAIPPRPWDGSDALHAYAADLDLFGPGSLTQLFPPLSRAPGRTTLAAWLLAPADYAAIAERQDAVRELTPHGELREELAVQGLYMTMEPDRLRQLQEWAGFRAVTGWTPGRIQATALVIGAVTWTLIGADLGGVIARPLWLIPAFVAVVISGFATRRLTSVSAHAFDHLPTLRAFGALLARVQGETLHAGLLRRAQADLTEGAYSALSSMQRLTRLADYSEVRRSPLPHFVLNALVLWDVHVLAGFQRWQATRGGQVAQWLAAIGTIEALAALATLAHDNPDWAFPEVTSGADRVDAHELGHPLLRREACVRNDVEVGPRGTLLVVSGSNMSGKSTLLRSIGLGLVMAQAGSTVCAARLRCPRLAVHTSIHIEDSLRRGISHFMAELLRIRSIVDAAASGRGATVLYLLDEVLHGTNSAERAIATERIMRHLLDLGALGAVTTHDLALFEAGALAAAAHHVHFTERISASETGRVMHFDYVLRPGRATSRNALALLELVGLPAGTPGGTPVGQGAPDGGLPGASA